MGTKLCKKSVNSANGSQHEFNLDQSKNSEVKCVIEIWSDKHISVQLSKMHKNTEAYKVFSECLKEMGFNQSVEHINFNNYS